MKKRPPADRARSAMICLRKFEGWSASARCGGGGGRPRVAERDPRVRVGLGLPFHETIAGFRPEHDLLVLIVENELAFVGLNGEHGMAVALLVEQHGAEHGLT